MLNIPLNAKQITSWELTKQSNALRDNGRFFYRGVCVFIYILLYIYTHASIVVKSGDADQLSLLDGFPWLIPVPVLFFLFGRNCVP